MATDIRWGVHRQTPTAITAVVITLAVIGFMYWASAVVVPLALAVFFTFILSPAVSRLRRWGVHKILAVVIVVMAAVTVAVGLGALILWQFAGLVRELPDHREKIRAKAVSVQAWFGSSDDRLGQLIEDVTSAIQPPPAPGTAAPTPVVIANAHPRWMDYAESAIGPTVEGAARAALTVVLTAFLLLGREDMRNRLLRLIGPHRMTAATRAVDEAGNRISRYLRVQLAINASFGVVVAVTLAALGDQYALLWGFIAGVLRYIPYLGAWLALLPPLVFNAAVADHWWPPVAFLAVYAAAELIESNVLEPRFLGHSLGLSEVAQITSAAFWAFLWGPIGLILAGPMTACLLVLARNVPSLHCLEVLLGVEEPLPADATLFQRLLARDRDEAWEIATDFAKERGAAALPDGLLLPTLSRGQAAYDQGELSEDDLAAFVQVVREIADDLGESATSNDEEPTDRARVLCLPTTGATAAALDLLIANLDHSRWEFRCLPANALASEAIAAVNEFQADAVMVVSVEKRNISQLRYLVKRMRSARPDVKIIVGHWGQDSLISTEETKLEQAGADGIATDITSTVRWLTGWQSSLAAAAARRVDSESVESTVEVGTLSAM